MTTHGKLAQKIHVRPSTNEIESYCGAHIDQKENEEEILSLPEISQDIIGDTQKRLSALKLNDQITSSNSKDEYPKITFLGTGSSVPSKYRGVSAILVENLPGRYIMMDCGEGTVLQLHRLFGRAKTLNILRGLSAVYLSHLHADHHLGLISIIKEREKAFDENQEPIEKLFLLAPSRLSVFLCMYHSKFEDILTDLCQVRNEHLLPFIPPSQDDLDGNKAKNGKRGEKEKETEKESPFMSKNPFSNKAVTFSDKVVTTQKLYPQILSALLKAVGLKSVKTCRALHCPGSFCVAFNFDYGKEEEGREFKLVYTGDTRPTEQLVELASNADLLIHEATMEHYMLTDCITKKHSTFTEAAECAKNANAKYTILTHFSQRYSKFPVFDEFENDKNIGCAWDLMTVTPKTFKFIRPCYEAVKVRFPEDLSEMVGRKEEFEYKNDGPGKRITRHLGLEYDDHECTAKELPYRKNTSNSTSADTVEMLCPQDQMNSKKKRKRMAIPDT